MQETSQKKLISDSFSLFVSHVQSQDNLLLLRKVDFTVSIMLSSNSQHKKMSEQCFLVSSERWRPLSTMPCPSPAHCAPVDFFWHRKGFRPCWFYHSYLWLIFLSRECFVNLKSGTAGTKSIFISNHPKGSTDVDINNWEALNRIPFILN